MFFLLHTWGGGGSFKIMQMKIEIHQPSPPLINARSPMTDKTTPSIFNVI